MAREKGEGKPGPIVAVTGYMYNRKCLDGRGAWADEVSDQRYETLLCVTTSVKLQVRKFCSATIRALFFCQPCSNEYDNFVLYKQEEYRLQVLHMITTRN